MNWIRLQINAAYNLPSAQFRNSARKFLPNPDRNYMFIVARVPSIPDQSRAHMRITCARAYIY